MAISGDLFKHVHSRTPPSKYWYLVAIEACTVGASNWVKILVICISFRIHISIWTVMKGAFVTIHIARFSSFFQKLTKQAQATAPISQVWLTFERNYWTGLFGCSRKTFRNHPNTYTDPETDADHKCFRIHASGRYVFYLDCFLVLKYFYIDQLFSLIHKTITNRYPDSIPMKWFFISQITFFNWSFHSFRLG